jgi:hypothetical protein
MKTWRGIALDNHYVGEFSDGRRFSLERGREYTLSGVDNADAIADGKVFLLSRCWNWVERAWFSDIKPEFGHSAAGRGPDRG